jgi:hypothetical protein
VVFTRTDGRNTPGVDVPYPFEGGMTLTAIPGTVSGSFILVRAQAKIEAPLLALRGLGGQLMISTTAEVTFYGHDQAGNAVSATGTSASASPTGPTPMWPDVGGREFGGVRDS